MIASGFQFRDYQDDCHHAVLAAFERYDSVLIELATGLGKTECGIRLANGWEGGRVLFIAHTKELVQQPARKIKQRTGWLPEVEQGSLYANETEWGRGHIVVASKASLHKGRLTPNRFNDIGLLIIDEAHRAAINNRSYQDIIDILRARNPRLKVLGMTATAKRHDKSAMSQVFEHVAFQMPIREGIDKGWLVPVENTCKQIKSMDFTEVKVTRKGDFHEDQLAKIIEQDKTLHEIASVTMQEGGANLKTLVFCPSVDAAEALCRMLNEGYQASAGWVCGDERRVSKEDRANILTAFHHGELNILVNVAVLTEGWDEPTVEHIVMAQPTASTPRYVQMLGRGTRPLPGEVDFPNSTPELRKEAIAASAKPCLRVTDLVDASLKHFIVSSVDVLSGEVDARAVQRAKENILAGNGRVSIDAETARAQFEIEEEDRERKEREKAWQEAEAKRRASLYGKAEYASIHVDPFSGNRAYGGTHAPRRISMVFGKYKGTPLDSVPTDYLLWFDKSLKCKAWLQNAVKDEIKRRDRPTYTHTDMWNEKQAPKKAALSLDEINQRLMEI